MVLSSGSGCAVFVVVRCFVASLGDALCAGRRVSSDAGSAGLEDVVPSVKGNTNPFVVCADAGSSLDGVDEPVDKADESGVTRLRYDLALDSGPDVSLPATDEVDDAEAE